MPHDKTAPTSRNDSQIVPAYPGPSNPIEVVDMHTGGEPLRIITSGYPDIPGTNILAKRRYAKDHLDHLRRFLMFEPRGHYDMYGAILVEPSLPDANLAVLFIHNEGYSTMCGHAILALGRYAIDYGLVKAVEPVTTVNIECPCGLVRAEVEVSNGKTGKVRFSSVPSFMFANDVSLQLADGTAFKTDIGYGGAFYAILDAGQFDIAITPENVGRLTRLAEEICQAVNDSVTLAHPDHDDLAFLYGAILTDGRDAFEASATRNICVFAKNQVDRSPTGSGVSARLAIQHAKGLIAPGDIRVFESVIGSSFEGSVEATTSCGPHEAIIASVKGKAHYSGKASFWYEEDDEVGRGFIVG
ncbi:proline racemase [Thalassospira tepidiphila]|jgi:proline racemase|uniref:proline racemase family protein n=1 Tax=Thalassospira tepidiphila TaxID=393657 RepID=UPI001BCB7D5D|nr:proline racemase family protein [Thalassospira tepidiphila]MBS8274950.1 proline racemase [Thalassospira tepidiphila]